MLLNTDQEMIRDAVRAFVQAEIAPHTARWDKEHTFPKEALKGLAALGAYGVCVPEEHVVSGVAPMTPGLEGTAFDWTTVTDGLFRVCVQKRRPRNAEAAVRYRGHWFSIAANDVNSRAALAIVELLFADQESEGKPFSPMLTLPLGG